MNKTLKYASFLSRLLLDRLRGRSTPLFTAYAVTNRCNYRCTYCYGDYHERRVENFGTEELERGIDDLAGLGTKVLNLIGGEPLLREDLGRFVDRARHHSMIATISTNASLVPERLDVVRLVDTIDTSLDGTEENNDKNRGPGTFRKTMAGIEKAVSAGVTTNVNMVLTRHNLEDVEAMARLARDMGFNLSFNIVFESHSEGYANHEQSLDIKRGVDDAFREALDGIIALKRRGFPIRFSEAAYRYARDWPVSFGGRAYTMSRAELGSFRPVNCLFGRFHCYVDTDGRMYNCLILKDRMPVISVREHGIVGAWERVTSVRTGCKACYVICNNDANMIFNLKPACLLEAARYVLRPPRAG